MQIIAGNFKANLSHKEVQDYTKALDSSLAMLSAKRHINFIDMANVDRSDKSAIAVDIFPSLCALSDDSFKHFHIGAQNAYYANSGAFTGEVGLEQLKAFNINRIIIGHSERRILLKEDSKVIANKFRFYAEAGFVIYYCIGEALDVRERGENALEAFLSAQLNDIDVNYKNLIVAYEPIWAIGSGKSASVEQIDATHNMIAKHTSAPLLYGGSVNATNARDILSLANVSGVLVGSASLNPKSFCEIIEAVI